jgi:hypothetical protein
MVGQSIMVCTLQDLDSNVISRNVPKEFAFLQLGIKSNFLKLVQNISYISFTFLHVLGENANVMNVTTNEIIQVFTKKSFMEHGKTIGDHNVFGMMSSIHR